MNVRQSSLWDSVVWANSGVALKIFELKIDGGSAHTGLVFESRSSKIFKDPESIVSNIMLRLDDHLYVDGYDVSLMPIW